MTSTSSMAASAICELSANSILKPLPPLSGNAGNAYFNSDDTKFIDMSDPVIAKGKISMTRAVVMSLILPGSGEYYAGKKFKGQIFMGVEAGIWAGYFAYHVYGGWKEDDYKALAASRAGVDNTGKDEQFYDLVGFYSNREEANQLGMLYNNDRVYLPDNNSYNWQWESEEARQLFRDLKDGSKVAYRNTTLMLMLALVNRLISGVDTYRTVKSVQRQAESLTQFGEYKLKISPKILGSRPEFKISLSRKF